MKKLCVLSRVAVVSTLTLACIAEANEGTRSPVPVKLFSCRFDGTVAPDVHGGSAAPTPRSRKFVFVPGRRGQALEMKSGCGSLLGFETAGNLNLEAGTVAFWFRPDEDARKETASQQRRMFVCTKTANPRAGSGTLWFWQYGSRLRCDQGDDADRHVEGSQLPVPNCWNHLVYTWGPKGVGLYLNGSSVVQINDSGSPLRTAMRNRASASGVISFSRRKAFEQFFIGGNGAGAYMDGAMDDLEIWSQPLDARTIAEMYRAAGGRDIAQAATPDYVKMFAAEATNPFEGEPLAVGGQPGARELVAKWTLDAVPTDTNRFNAIGAMRVGSCDGTPYVEAGGNRDDRFALRFNLGENLAPLYAIEVDYPDDRPRTMDLIVQNARQVRWDGEEEADYILQVGVMAGDEYRSSGKILTHRCLYWPRVSDIALLALTARPDAPAAISEVRVYRLKSPSLPKAAIREPAANANGWHRSFALYYEDPAIGYGFNAIGIRPETIGPMIDRVAALMKYTGQNLFCYPGAWYSGVIGENYMPRQHPRGYREAWYAKFDREGLGFMPTINQNNMPVPPGLVTYEKMQNGALHPSCISIWETGKPNPGGWHGTPPNFNIAHPDVQAMLEREFDAFIAEGKGHPSFRGVVLHLTRHCLCWFGDIRAGYNDYCVEAFARARGVTIPATIDRNAPLRGADYAKWLQGDAAVYEQWLDWRCETVANLYRRLAARLKAARPDLKLVVNTFLLPDVHHPDFPKATFIPEANRRAGLDARKLADVENISICQTEIPADYRFFGPKPGRWRREADVAEPAHRVLYTRTGDFGLLDTAVFPWVNQHDRYFENACGAGKTTLSSPWLKECRWRVTTLNPAGRHALRAYAVPLGDHDVLAYSKGGFLIGTYGTEEVVVPWMQAFRALPAVRMAEFNRAGSIVARRTEFRGRTYFYLVNTGDEPAAMTLRLEQSAVNLVTGETLRAGEHTFRLDGYALRAYGN